jgi:acyl carrier protein phosphodiesterase
VTHLGVDAWGRFGSEQINRRYKAHRKIQVLAAAFPITRSAVSFFSVENRSVLPAKNRSQPPPM